MRYLHYLLKAVATRNLYRFLLFILWNLPFADEVIHDFDRLHLRPTYVPTSESDRMILQESCSRLSAVWAILENTSNHYDHSKQIDVPFQCGGNQYSFKITKNSKLAVWSYENNAPPFVKYTTSHENLTSIYDTIAAALQSDIFWFLSTTNAILKDLSITQIKNIMFVQESGFEVQQFMQLLRIKSASLGLLHLRFGQLSETIQNKDRTIGTKRRRSFRM